MRRKTQRNLAEVLRDEMYMQDRVTETLKGGPRTIPEIAQKLNCPSPEVTKMGHGYATIWKNHRNTEKPGR